MPAGRFTAFPCLGEPSGAKMGLLPGAALVTLQQKGHDLAPLELASLLSPREKGWFLEALTGTPEPSCCVVMGSSHRTKLKMGVLPMRGRDGSHGGPTRLLCHEDEPCMVLIFSKFRLILAAKATCSHVFLRTQY
jgi:hypothetical protein